MGTVRSAPLFHVLRLEVPLVVRLGERLMSVTEVTHLIPGAIIELPKNAEAELDLLCNDRQIGTGTAVKVGENFGIRLTFIGDLASRMAAVAAGQEQQSTEDAEAAAMAEAMLNGQI
jgi:flagellar motor switch protein FliN